MNGDMFLGTIIISIAVGSLTGAVWGWLLFGILLFLGGAWDNRS